LPANTSTGTDAATATSTQPENGELNEDGLSAHENLQWSLDGLRTAQREDADVGFVIQLLQVHEEKPGWELSRYNLKFWKRCGQCGRD
jgi:hypothetical protein